MLREVEKVLLNGDFEFEIYFKHKFLGKDYQFCYAQHYNDDERVAIKLDNLQIAASYATFSFGGLKNVSNWWIDSRPFSLFTFKSTERVDTEQLKAFAKVRVSEALCDMKVKDLECFYFRCESDLDILLVYDEGKFELTIDGDEINDNEIIEYVKTNISDRLG